MTNQSSCLMQRRVLLMRHAKSGWSDTSLHDHQRPLNPRGVRDAPRIAHALQRLEWTPSHVYVSDSKRTLSTLEGMKTIFGDLKIHIMESLYHSPATTILECIQKSKQEEVTLILSHNPGTEMVLYQLTGVLHEMPTAACALLVEQGGKWHCQHVLRPKKLDQYESEIGHVLWPNTR